MIADLWDYSFSRRIFSFHLMNSFLKDFLAICERRTSQDERTERSHKLFLQSEPIKSSVWESLKISFKQIFESWKCKTNFYISNSTFNLNGRFYQNKCKNTNSSIYSTNVKIQILATALGITSTVLLNNHLD